MNEMRFPTSSRAALSAIAEGVGEPEDGVLLVMCAEPLPSGNGSNAVSHFSPRSMAVSKRDTWSQPSCFAHSTAKASLAAVV